ncbi:(d)CMP kinase [Streptococcus ovuberis]|uniref:Cytidylate kinase n=1 Tax=Streptococcus ovuberis TaxID=1936207 RepID=A0A7X6MYR9_9STRE|nr:(d)CMP kinase [Streptococcus ovuberis]NKZ20905.1 (d)CMP kinase [Streptococcus ovuberis]
MRKIQIAIDGPASSGKSTVAKLVAKELGYTYLDTGAMYRCVTLLALENNWSDNDLALILEGIDRHKIRFETSEDGGQLVFLEDRDVTHRIRENDVTNNVSWVSAFAEVRQKLVEQQQEIAAEGGIIMDGRDIGTVVLPNAELKIFLVASVEERADRRYKENMAKGIPVDLETLKQEIADRDYKDSTREASPLKAAEDAVVFDTTGVAISGVVEFISEKVSEILDNGHCLC